MIQLVENGNTVFRCQMCGTTYKAHSAARACENAHLDERRTDRTEHRRRSSRR